MNLLDILICSRHQQTRREKRKIIPRRTRRNESEEEECAREETTSIVETQKLTRSVFSSWRLWDKTNQIHFLHVDSSHPTHAVINISFPYPFRNIRHQRRWVGLQL
jgi:hypothetical protein